MSQKKHRKNLQRKKEKLINDAMARARGACRGFIWKIDETVLHHSEPDSILKIREIFDIEVIVEIIKSEDNSKVGTKVRLSKMEIFTLQVLKQELQEGLLGKEAFMEMLNSVI